MPYTYAQAHRLRLRFYFDILYRGFRGPADSVRVQAVIIKRHDRMLPRVVRGTFSDCPPPSEALAQQPLYEIVLLSQKQLPVRECQECGIMTLESHCEAYGTAL